MVFIIIIIVLILLVRFYIYLPKVGNVLSTKHVVNNNTRDIDIVITWVDSSDEKWKKDRNKYYKILNKGYNCYHIQPTKLYFNLYNKI